MSLLKSDLKISAGLLKESAPKNHILAYITPSERDMLVEAGGVKTPTESGIFAYPPDNWASSSYSSPSKSPGHPSNNPGSNENQNTSGDSQDAKEQYSVKQSSTGFVKGGGDVTFLGGNSNDPSNYAVSDAIVDSAVTQKEQEKYAEQFGGVAPLGSRPVGFNTKAEYNQMKYIAGSQLNSIKAKLKEAGFTDFNKDANLLEMKDYVKTLNRTGKIGDNWKNAKDTKGNPLYSPETIAKWESLNYFPQSPTMPAPGVFGKLMEKASPSGTLGAPLTYDQLLADFDTITEVGQSKGMGFQERMKTFQPNRYAAQNGLLYNGKTKTFTKREGTTGSEQDRFQRSNAPYEEGETEPQESQAAKWYSNIGNNTQQFNFATAYANAKTKVSQQLNNKGPIAMLAVNDSPYYDWLKTKGLDKGIL